MSNELVKSQEIDGVEIRVDKSLPDEWEFESSVQQARFKINRFADDFSGFLHDAWVAREKLSQTGRPKSGTNVSLNTWDNWCGAIGYSKTHVNRLLAKYYVDGVLVSKFTGEQENYTPSKVITLVKNVLGRIDLDPASCEEAQKTIQAKEYYTEEMNGLDQEWYGNVFLNPPYQMPKIREFTDKMVDELPNIDNAVLLTNNNTDTLWFHKCTLNAKAVCLTKGRINFLKDGQETQPTNGQAFFFFGDNVDSFVNVFSDIGLIMKVWNK